jgi:16S rRNA (cytosine1402-N4)-methyltransferase
MESRGLTADVVLADLGFASPQVDDASRGLSFMRDGPLDMRLDPTAPVTAAELVATMSESELADMLRDYGEEPAARAIAQKLVSARRASPILTTSRLAEIVRSAVHRPRTPGRRPIDPATKTFQALRIAVNDELGSLNALLAAVRRGAARAAAGPAAAWLRPGARVGIISFHSLEDRPVKQAFAGLVEAGLADDLSRGHVGPADMETESNPRSRSAKLRVVRIRSSAPGPHS